MIHETSITLGLQYTVAVRPVLKTFRKGTLYVGTLWPFLSVEFEGHLHKVSVRVCTKSARQAMGVQIMTKAYNKIT